MRSVGAVAAVLVSLVAAGSALAAPSFSPTGQVVQSGTLTWKTNGGSPVTCPTTISGSAGNYMLGNSAGTCANGATLIGNYMEQPLGGPGAYSVRMPALCCTHYGPFGQYWLYPPTVPFVNGNASTPSTMTFNNTYVGDDVDTAQRLTVSGTLTVTTPSGGLVTLIN